MLIKESEIMSSPLDDIQYIEQPISEATIPVTENSRLGKYIVSVEDITKFCEDTNSDPGYVISQICESNGIETDTLAFSVKEESVILGESAANISVALMNEGADVLAAPTSHNWLWMAIGEGIQEKFGIPLDEVSVAWVQKKLGYEPDKISSYDFERRADKNDVDFWVGTGYKGRKRNYDSDNIKSHNYDDDEKNEYITGNGRKNNSEFIIKHGLGFLPINNTYQVEKGKYAAVKLDGRRVSDHNSGYIDNGYIDNMAQINSNGVMRIRMIGRSVRGFHKGHVGRETNKIERMAHRADNRMDKSIQNSENRIKDMENFEKKMQDEIDDLHRSNNKNLIAKGLAKLHDWAKRLNEKYKETKVSGPKTAIKKALSWITGAIASLTRRLHNLTTKKENAIND